MQIILPVICINQFFKWRPPDDPGIGASSGRTVETQLTSIVDISTVSRSGHDSSGSRAPLHLQIHSPFSNTHRIHSHAFIFPESFSVGLRINSVPLGKTNKLPLMNCEGRSCAPVNVTQRMVGLGMPLAVQCMNADWPLETVWFSQSCSWIVGGKAAIWSLTESMSAPAALLAMHL